ncbi:DNA-binding transcriptional regulator, MarR family [Geodermatophilus obscurus]|jgi:DNA-binding MarR family transcriptional regulator|uniref:DNA-binding transcriptional regulator, MarR family n=2 Tax=Geodermatophilus obscurus TaxID=1861 RepID=A0A1I5G604_9ACTN|nr:DNA-binding transcriptional regulator, MarR family [Geodermatophilus obscurus]
MALVVAGRAMEDLVAGRLAPLGLSLRLFGALGHLARDEGLSYTELARRARVTTQSMHATVGRLVDLGAVEPAGPGRGRRAGLRVTERGRRLLADGHDAVDALDAELTAALDRSGGALDLPALLAVLGLAGRLPGG